MDWDGGGGLGSWDLRCICNANTHLGSILEQEHRVWTRQARRKCSLWPAFMKDLTC